MHMGYYFWQESRTIWSFRRPVMFLFAETMEYIFRVSPMICQRFLFRWQLRYFLDKIRLVFGSFLALFHGFLCFLAAFSKVLSSRSIKFVLSKNNYECFLNFIVQLCRFSFVSNLFFPFIFTLFFLAFIYNNLCINVLHNVYYTKLGHIGLPKNRRQNKKYSVHCGVIMHAQ